MAARTVEVRLELDEARVRVLDGYCSATGKTRTDVIRGLLQEWSSRELHEATLICRVAGVNPAAPVHSRDVGDAHS